jgi:drug/metabolite transporter (DMT)-like permease
MIRPTSDAMHWAALLPLCAASMGALRDVVTRRIRMSDSPVAILAFTMGAVALAGFATLPLGWKPVAWDDLLIMATAGILVGSAQYLMIYAFHVAEASLIIPFKYLTLIWGAVFGFMVWGHIPDQGIVAGSVLVVGSGLYIMHRETRMHRRRLRGGG